MKKQNMILNGAEIFFECLKQEKVEYIFGYPGGAVLKIYEQLYGVDFLKHILVRHEQGAVHMAEGYAKASGKTGVVLVTSGPGATNAVTGIADAYMDSVPVVVFTGQVASNMLGKDSFQEVNIVGITRPVTKYNFQVRDVNELAMTIKKAFYIASTGRPGPVVIDLPKDILVDKCEFSYPGRIELRGYKPSYSLNQKQIKQAADVLRKSKRPVLYVGGGVISSGGSRELFILAKENNLPVTMTLQGLGAFPGNDDQSLGMLGMHGTYCANQAVNNCDLLIALGARFDDRVTGKASSFAKDAFKIHVDIEPAQINKNVFTNLSIIGDVKHIIAEIAAEIGAPLNFSEWWKQINEWREEFPLSYDSQDGRLRTEFVYEKLFEKTEGNAVIVTDVGQHQMWGAQYFRFVYPRTHITSGGLGTMGFSLPASIGAYFAVKDRTVISVNGDGGFQMNIQELVTAAAYKIPLKIIVINNNNLGMVRQWQELFFGEKYSFTDLSESNPDFVKVAEAFGCRAFSTDSPKEVDSILDKAFSFNDGPAVVEFNVVRDDLVFPMVPAGRSISDMVVRK